MTAAVIPLPTNAAAAGHPAWCAQPDETHPTCHSLPTTIPATAGRWASIDGDVAYPGITIETVRTADGTPAVYLEISDPTGTSPTGVSRHAGGTLRAGEARALAATLLAALTEAQGA